MSVMLTALLFGLTTSLASAELEKSEGEHRTVAGSHTTCSCGFTNEVLGISEGREIRRKEFQFFVSVFNEFNVYICGAVLVSDSHAITTASCLKRNGDVNITVFAGLHHKEKESEKSVRVENVILHKNFHQINMIVIFDIAILKLAEALVYSDIYPACMPLETNNLKVDQTITLLVWRWTDVNQRRSVTLQPLYSTVLEETVCNNIFESEVLFGGSDGLLSCASSPGNTFSKDDCGAPAFYFDPEINRYVLVGLVSYAYVEPQENMPAVLTSVYPYMHWIKSVVNESFCNKV